MLKNQTKGVFITYDINFLRKKTSCDKISCHNLFYKKDYIMPGMPPIPAGIAGAAGAFASGLSATNVSVVNTKAAIDAAFCNADRVTFAGSTIPDATISTYSSVNALKPMPLGEDFTLDTITDPSNPALAAI